MAAALPAAAVVAVIGASTMGAGIALVAARAAHLMHLHDAAPSAVERSIAALRLNVWSPICSIKPRGR